MIVQMIPVDVSSDDHFTVTKTLCHLYANVMGLLRGQPLLRLEGLHIVVEANIASFATEMILLGCMQ